VKSLEETVNQWRLETEALQPSPVLLARLEETLGSLAGRVPIPEPVPADHANDGRSVPPSKPGPAEHRRASWLRTPPVGPAILLAGCLIILGGVGLLRYRIAVHEGVYVKARPPEPTALTRKPITQSFGCGEDVTYQRCDMKVFDFEFVTATRSVVLLHFQSQNVSEGEVIVSVNGADMGRLPADSLNAADVSHEFVVPSDLLQRGHRNKFIFDNVRNPPASDTWRIWNLWVEVVPLPEESGEDLLREAHDAYLRGQRRAEHRDVGASNRYEAWLDFRRAWLLLESLPEPKPELYMLARTKMRDSQHELDMECQKQLMEVRGYYSHKDWSTARSALDVIEREFPHSDQACPLRAAELRAELAL
jgi:hypothetical protein